MQIHIIQVYTNTHYSSVSYILKEFNISITYPVHVHLWFIHNISSNVKILYKNHHKTSL